MAVNLPLPIPVGSPHLAEPPIFERWGLNKVRRLDKRDYSRRSLARDLWLIDNHAQSVLRCRTDDISDAGLHASAPIGFGLAIGQRYELRIARGELTRALPGHFGKSLGYATVIRTEMHIDDGRSDRVGFAVRFDVPQLIDV